MKLTMRRMMTVSAFSFAVLTVAGYSSASSPDAWQALYDTRVQACLKQSGLKNAQVVEGPLLFPSTILYKIQGVWPQAHMKDKPANVYCLHPYPHGEPEVVEASSAD